MPEPSLTREEIIRIRNLGCDNEWPKVWNRQLNELCDIALSVLAAGGKNAEYHFVCDGPPSHESGRFVELENERGQSIGPGRWERIGNYWHLIVPAPAPALQRRLDEILALVDGYEDINASGGPNVFMQIAMIARGEDRK